MIPLYEYRSEPMTIIESQDITFPVHLHNSFEMLYVRSGQATAILDDTTYTLNPGDFLIVFPEVMHNYTTLTPPEQTDIVIMICSLPLSGRFLNILQKYTPTDCVIRAANQHPDIAYATEGLVGEYRQNHAGSTLNTPIIQAFVLLLLGRVIPQLRLSRRSEAAQGNLIGQVVSYIGQHYRQPLSLEEVANEVGISKYHLSRLFHQKMHIGFSEYVNNLRIDLAHELLRSTDWDIKKISQYCGFETQRSFNRVFRQFTDVSPREYRNRAERSTPTAE